MAVGIQKHTIIDLRNLEPRVACLTLDVEQDYGDLLEEPSYDELGYTSNLVDLFKEREIPLTCFVPGSLLATHPSEIEKLTALDVEFELHSYLHLDLQRANTSFEVGRGKEAYRKFFGENPVGYRAQMGVISDDDYKILAMNGFRFDSSIFPSFRPNVFNNLRQPTRPYLLRYYQIVEFPFTVFSGIIRIPIALSYMKLLGRPYFYLLKSFPLPRLIVFDFHLHDLFRLQAADKISFKKLSPMYRTVFRRVYYEEKVNGMRILDEFITLLRHKKYTFLKLTDVYERCR